MMAPKRGYLLEQALFAPAQVGVLGVAQCVERAQTQSKQSGLGLKMNKSGTINYKLTGQANFKLIGSLMTVRNQTSFDSLPLVSIIMPCRNVSSTISQAVDSVINQNYFNLELIIIDDGSTDASVEIISEYCSIDRRIVFVRNSGKNGVSSARNAGLAIAKGRFIAFLDADDYLTEDSVRRRVQYCIDNNAQIVFGPYSRLLPNGVEVLVVPPPVISFADMLKRNYIGNLTGLYDADYFGVVMQHNIRHEDYLMWCCLLRKANFAFSVSSFPLGVYRVSASSLSGNKIQSALWHWNVLRHGLGIGFLVSAYYQLCYVLSSVFDRAIALLRIYK